MLRFKKGLSLITLVLCGVIITLGITALVVATNNSAIFMAKEIASKQNTVIETGAYTKIYSVHQVETVARQSFANNYLYLYDQEIDLEGFKVLVIGEIMQTIPAGQLENYDIQITADGVDVKNI